MMKSILVTLSLLAPALSLAAPLTCAQIERSVDQDENINYFREGRFKNPSAEVMEVQIRAAVRNFYGDCGSRVSISRDYCYRSVMTLAQVDELGEGVTYQTVQGKNGQVFNQVNVGFGGGNGASYYFERGTGIMQPFMITDSAECSQTQRPVKY